MTSEILERMCHPVQTGGVDILIVSTGSACQQKYWEDELERLRGIAFPATSKVIVINEDWPGGAGSGFGTLYAYQKAAEQSSLNLLQLQAEGATIALFHTAGKGKRLCPLTLSADNNKSAVKLFGNMPILEAVIRQSAAFAPFHKGRLLVFWGDQLFIPSVTLSSPIHAIEVFAKPLATPSETEWNEKQFSNYGIITDIRKDAQHLDKLDYPTYSTHAESSSYVSLGSFSLSASITQALLETFQTALKAKEEPQDVESYIWMPLTLPWELYQQLVPTANPAHFSKMQTLKSSVKEPLYTLANIGADAYWWDFGNIQSFYQNHMKVLENSSESKALRKFFQLEQGSNINSSIHSGDVQNSLLINVTANHLDVENCVLINSKFNSLIANEALFYQVDDEGPLNVHKKTVRSDAKKRNSEKQTFYTSLERDGKKDWSVCLPENDCSYESISDRLRY